jgi:hypothetical protein
MCRAEYPPEGKEETMMKHGKWIVALILVLGLFVLAVPSGQTAHAARILTFDRAIQINDYQVVLEFSEPIAINLKQQNSGPYCAVRLVTNEKNELGKSKEGTILQWKGTIEYADSERDRLVWTLADNRLGVTTVSDIVNHRGNLASYTDYKVKFCVEEIPFDSTVPAATGLLDNVTTADGEVHLSANRPIGYDGAYCPIEVDFNYPLDPTKTQSLINRTVNATMSINTKVENAPVDEVIIDASPEPLMAALIIGGGVVLAAIMIVIGAVIAKKRRGVA